MRCISQRGGPVITGRQIKIDKLVVAQLCRRKQGLQLAPRINLLVQPSGTIHDDIGQIEHIGIFQRSCFRVIAGGVHCLVIDTGTERRVERECIPLLFHHQYGVSVILGFLIVHLDITPIGSRQRRSGRGIELLAHLVR